MSPFESAWLLLKMPLMPETVREVSPNKFEAKFYNPKTGKTHPMQAQRHPDKWESPDTGKARGAGSTTVNVLSPESNFSNSPVPPDTLDYGMNDNLLAGTHFEQSDFSDGVVLPMQGKPNSQYAWNTDVKPDNQRQGMASAMYDMANMVTPETIIPSPRQSPEGQGLWTSNNPTGWETTVQQPVTAPNYEGM